MTKLHIISLGAGVQSSTMALMAAHGEIEPMPDCAIFADTGAEPAAVYQHLDWLEGELPFPVIRVSGGNLRRHIGSERRRKSDGAVYYNLAIPAFVGLPNGSSAGFATRECTRQFKIRPIVRELRRQLGLTGKRTPPGILVEQWIGISLDEAIRMKPSRDAWIKHRWPLVDGGLRRQDCLNWFGRHYPGRSLTKSACTFCPYRTNAEWRALAPAEFADAVAVDATVRKAYAQVARDKGKSFFLHRDLVPLDQVDLSTAEDHGQLDLFLNECEGMCGV